MFAKTAQKQNVEVWEAFNICGYYINTKCLWYLNILHLFTPKQGVVYVYEKKYAS